MFLDLNFRLKSIQIDGKWNYIKIVSVNNKFWYWIFLLFKDIKTLEKESYSFFFLFKLSN